MTAAIFAGFAVQAGWSFASGNTKLSAALRVVLSGFRQRFAGGCRFVPKVGTEERMGCR